MTITLTSQQTSFFNKNGFLELEGLLSSIETKKYHLAILESLEKRKSKNFIVQGRDLWRESATLKSLVCSRKLSNIALMLTGKPAVRLACDQWFSPAYSLAKPASLKDLLSVQGILCGMIIQLQPGNFEIPEKVSPLGLLPFPKEQGSVLLIKPSLLLNWPSISAQLGLYLVVYSESAAVYIQNEQDPAGTELKHLGYGYGDRLNNDNHPVFSK
jgi:hypothetical protein